MATSSATGAVKRRQAKSGVKLGAADAWSMQILTIHVNAWTPFKEKWTSAGEPPVFESATAIVLQEHKLLGRDQCRDAEEWCSKRG